MTKNQEKQQENAEQRNKKEIDWQFIEKQACQFLRISGTWYKKCFHPVTGEMVLEHFRAEDVMKDFGRENGTLILGSAPKYVNYVNFPDHLNHKEDLVGASQDHYFNLYREIKYKPVEGGEWDHIKKLFKHIFGEQYELGLDYVELLYLKPQKRLPVLVLVSRENGTGKSTFCNFLHALFGANCCQITNDSLRSNFNSWWVTKLIAYCEETLLNRREDSEKIKNLTTAETVPSEAKGKDSVPVQVFIKFILCSNDEDRPIVINADDTRHWVRKVPKITEKNPNEDFLEECKKEIPAFLYYLMQRQLSTSGRDRLWFTPEETRTDAWRRIVAGGMTALAKEIVAMMLHIMEAKELFELKYSAESLYQMVVMNGAPYNLRCPCSRTIIRDILIGWGLKATKVSSRYDYYVVLSDGTVRFEGKPSGKVYSISRDLLETLYF